MVAAAVSLFVLTSPPGPCLCLSPLVCTCRRSFALIPTHLHLSLLVRARPCMFAVLRTCSHSSLLIRTHPPLVCARPRLFAHPCLSLLARLCSCPFVPPTWCPQPLVCVCNKWIVSKYIKINNSPY